MQPHRVIVPESEDLRQKVRLSVVFFFHPDSDVAINCLDGSDTYQPVAHEEYYISRENTIRYITKLINTVVFRHSVDR